MHPLAVIVPIHRRADILNLAEQISISSFASDIFFVFVLDRSHEHDLENHFQNNLEKFNLNMTVKSGLYGNPGAARNAGLEEIIETVWIMYLDADDRLELDDVFSYLRQHQTSPFPAIVFDYEESHPFKGSRRIDSRDKVDLALNPGLWRIAFRADAIRGIRFPSLMLGEDQIYFLRTHLLNKNIAFSGTVGYRHRIETGSNISETQKNYIFYRNLLHLFLSELESYSLKALYRDLFLLRLFSSSLKRKTLLVPSQYLSIANYFFFKSNIYIQFLAIKNFSQRRRSSA
jgi:hypothetical protein